MANDRPLHTPTLALLVRQRMAATGKTFRQLQAESGVSSATFHKMASGQVKQLPAPAIARAVAAALGIETQQITAAFMQDQAVHEELEEDRERMHVYNGMSGLSRARQLILVEVVDDMRRASGLPPVTAPTR